MAAGSGNPAVKIEALHWEKPPGDEVLPAG